MDVLQFARDRRAKIIDEVAELDRFITMAEQLLREDTARKQQSAQANQPAPKETPTAGTASHAPATTPEPIPLPDPSATLPNVALSWYQGAVDKADLDRMLREERDRRHALVRPNPATTRAPEKTAATG